MSKPIKIVGWIPLPKNFDSLDPCDRDQASLYIRFNTKGEMADILKERGWVLRRATLTIDPKEDK